MTYLRLASSWSTLLLAVEPTQIKLKGKGGGKKPDPCQPAVCSFCVFNPLLMIYRRRLRKVGMVLNTHMEI